MFSVRNFRELIPYKKALKINKDILKEELTAESYEQVTFIIIKLVSYIAKAEGCALYLNDRKNSFKKAIKWTNLLDKKINELNLSEEKKKQYKNEVTQIRRILISFEKKLEDNK